jgi:hypothetical protein
MLPNGKIDRAALRAEAAEWANGLPEAGTP